VKGKSCFKGNLSKKINTMGVVELTVAVKIRVLFSVFFLAHLLVGNRFFDNYLEFLVQSIFLYGVTYFLVVKILPKINSYFKSFLVSIIIPLFCAILTSSVYENFLALINGNYYFQYKRYLINPIVIPLLDYLLINGLMLSLLVFILCCVNIKNNKPEVAAKFIKALSKRLIIILAVLIPIWYFVFVYDYEVWTEEGGSERCYSPNREYYIIRYQTLADSFSLKGRAFGTPKLYNKEGKLLHSAKAYLSLEFGPYWFNERGVGYMAYSPEWHFRTPTPTGKSGWPDCF
jgi:hypothetical protein